MWVANYGVDGLRRRQRNATGAYATNADFCFCHAVPVTDPNWLSNLLKAILALPLTGSLHLEYGITFDSGEFSGLEFQPAVDAMSLH
ncbi:MAG: hypothetical protein IPI17_16950 [Nitrosomonas sp.]|nr:hypothetical protein [Nitrosomonas sp.]